jgi:hypothetical protein
LITPKGENVIKSEDKKDTNIFQQGWASNPEYNPPGFAIDHSFRRHVTRHTNKLILRIHYLYLLEHEIITEKLAEKCLNPEISHTEIDLKPPTLGEFPPNTKWDSECDKSFLIGVFRHGMENNDAIKADENLCFIEKLEDGGFLSTTDINNRFKKLLQHHIRQAEIALQNQTSIRNQIKLNAENRGNWTSEEENDFIRVIINYGVWDQTQNDKVNIKWTKFRERAASLAKKTDVQLMENLYCVLARCSKVQNSPLGEADEIRAKILERIPSKKCSMILHRLTLMRKVHINGMTKDENFRRTHIRMIPLSNMPKGWTYELDERLFNVADTFGVNQLRKKLATLSEFKAIEIPSNKELWHRLYEIVLTLENGKYGGTFDPIQYDEESEDERQDELWEMALKNAEKQATLPSATPEPSTSAAASGGGGGGSSRRTQNKKKANAAAAAIAAASSTPSSSSKKDINSAHQNFVKQMDQASLQQQSYLLMQAAAALASAAGSGSGKQGSSSNSASATAAANDIVAQIAQLQAILQFTNSTTGLTNASFNKAIEDALNLSKKDSTPAASTSSSSKPSTSATTSQKISTPSISQKPSTSSDTPAATASSSTASTSSAASIAYAQMNSAEAAAFEKAALDQLGIGFAELMVLQSLDPNSIICMHNPETKHTVSGDKAPTLKNLEAYIRKNPKYKVDFNATLTALSATTLSAKTPSSSKASTSKAPTQNGVSSSSTANTPKVSTATAPSLPSLEPGEIPKASTSAASKAASNSNSSIANEYENIQISVFSKTGATINKDKFPTIKTLQTYLDKNPDMNVTSNHAPIAKTLLPKSYHNRIGGEAELYNQMAALMALNSSMFGLGGTSASTPSAFNLSGTSAGSSSSNNNNSSSNSAAAQQAQQALEAQIFLMQQSMNPLMGYNYASMLANMPGMSGSGLSGTSLSQFTTPTSSTSTKAASTSAAKPSISAGTSSKSAAAAAAAAANAAAATSSSSANNTASQMLTEAALTAEILNNPQLAQLFAMSMSGVGTGAPSTSSASASTAAQNQLNAALYGMDANQMSQIQALNMLSMLAMPVLTAATPTPSTPATSTTKASSSNTEKKASSGTGNSTPTASKKSLGKIVEDLSKTPASSSS